MKNKEDLIDKIVLLMVSGLNESQLMKACRNNLELSEDQAKELMEDAEKKILKIGDIDKKKEVGVALKRLSDIYTRSIVKGDVKTALQVQREIDKLGGLYIEEGEEPDNDQNIDNINALEELERIASHLLPLELADKDYPLREHARIAAERIREGENFGED